MTPLTLADLAHDASLWRDPHGPWCAALSRLSALTSARTHLYVVRAGDRVKIGKSIDPTTRIAELGVGCPVPLEVLAIAPEAVEAERQAHRRWEALRRHREWFECTPELEAWAAGIQQRAARLAVYQVRLRALLEAPFSWPIRRLVEVEIDLRRRARRRAA